MSWKGRVAVTYQKNFLEATEKFSNHFPHLGHQFEYAQRSQAPKNHQELSPRFSRHVLRHPTKKYQTHLEGKMKSRNSDKSSSTIDISGEAAGPNCPLAETSPVPWDQHLPGVYAVSYPKTLETGVVLAPQASHQPYAGVKWGCPPCVCACTVFCFF